MFRRAFCKLGATGLVSLAISRKIDAFEKVVSASAKKWAIVYGSSCGSTREYAGFINEGLGGIADVIDIATATPKVEDYEYFIIGGWRNASAVKPDNVPNFIKNNKSALKDKIKGLFIVVGNGGKATLSTDITNFLKQTLITQAGVNESVGKVFFGRSADSCNHLGLNYDNVKKEDGVAFGKKILDENKTGISLDYLAKNGAYSLSCHSNMSGHSPVINYSIPTSGHVELTICSIQGKKIITLVSQYQNAGYYRVPMGGRNLTPGQYIYRLESGSLVKTITAAFVQ